MTAVNIWLEDDRALVAVDSACVDGRDHSLLNHGTCKLVPLTHAGVVMAGIGSVLGFHVPLAAALADPGICGFDAAVERMPRHLASYLASLPAVLQQFADEGHDPAVAAAAVADQDLRLVGWSERSQCMQAANFARRAGGPFEFTIAEGGSLSPWSAEALGDPGAYGNDLAMMKIMRRQIAHLREHHEHLRESVGGFMVLAELTRHEISIRRKPLAQWGEFPWREGKAT